MRANTYDASSGTLTVDPVRAAAFDANLAQTGAIETFRWLRVIGDTIFAAGAVALAIFVIGLRTGGSTGRQPFQVGEPVSARGRS